MNDVARGDTKIFKCVIVNFVKDVGTVGFSAQRQLIYGNIQNSEVIFTVTKKAYKLGWR